MSETTILDEPGVRVTTARVSSGAAMVPVSAIASVHAVEAPPDRRPLIVLAGLALAGSPVGLWFADVHLPTGVAVGAVAAVAILVASFVLQRSSYRVEVRSSGLVALTIATRDRAFAQKIVAAVHVAVAERR